MSNENSKDKKVANVPNLRFGTGLISMPIIGDVSGLRKTTKVFPKTLYISTENLISDFGGYKKFSENIPIKGTYFKRGDTLVANIRPYLKKVFFAAFDGCASSDVLVFQPKKVFPLYFFYCLANEKFVNYIMLNAKGSKMPRGDKWWMLKKKIAIVPLEEQKKTALFLSLIDERIVVQNKIISSLESQRKSIIDSFFLPITNSSTSLSLILKERKTFCEKGQQYEHVTLSKEGIVQKTERYDRDFLVKNLEKEYKITKKNDICYNPANLKFGVICLNDYGDAIFSPIYVTFEVLPNYDPYYVSLYLTSKRFISRSLRYQQGTVYERMAVSPEDLLKMKMPLVKNETTITFTLLVKNIDLKIAIEKAVLNYFLKEKDYLLQNLFI